MTPEQKQHIIDTSWELHEAVEKAYLEHQAKKGDASWPEKQRLLLADMALHLLQTAMSPQALSQDKLRNNLHAIMTISDQYLPSAQLAKATERLYLPNEQ
ncbi:hypothetical protein [Planctobacterium marinum]|uniref:hypothetical protein n=1 Tax=Planctobacterium marinum TaxID=1631968 RepID=UPI001E50DB46|nr:hypothetical protein [Planctobacterium marinum]MCC2605988.1 hypothetical protein [Planctobacterium marinum]